MGTTALFDAETWERALEQYGGVTRLTAWVFDREQRLVCRPHPTTLLSGFFERHGFEPAILGDCVCQSLAPSSGSDDVTIAESFGLAVVGTPLRLDGAIVGAAVAGYALVDFCQASAIESFAHHAGLPFRQLWQIATQVQPLTRHRLVMHGQLLSILGATILTAHERTRQVEDNVGHLERRVQERTRELAAANTTLAAEVGERAAAEERARRLLSRLVVVRDEERHRIALDIHDHMGQQLTALKLRLDLLQTLGPASGDWAKQLGHTQEMVARLDNDVESFTSDLRPLFVENLGVVRALANLVAEWRGSTGVAAHFTHRGGDLQGLAGEVQINLFRIAQEALHNVSKHAQATAVDVELEQVGDRVTLTLSDDGRGFDVTGAQSSATGLGLIGMHERASLIAGTLAIESTLERGTRIRLSLSLGANASRF